MKDEIIGILQSCVNVWDMDASGGSPVPVMKDEYIWIIQGIERLICYREVRQHISTLSELGLLHYAVDHIPENEIIDIINRLKDDYPESLIQEAIEKVKNEQK